METKITAKGGLAPKLYAIALGQAISLAISGTGVFSQYLSRNGVDVPMLQSLPNYLLCTLFLIPRWRSNEDWTRVKSRWYLYPMLAVVDVEANFLVVKAYQYADIATISLIDTFTIPTVIVLSYFVFKRRYNLIHAIGTGITLAGIATVVAYNFSEKSGGSQDRVKGAMLALAGSFLYGVSNIGQEFLVTGHGLRGNFEFLGLLGLFGSMLSLVQGLSLELDNFQKIEWTGAVVGYFVGFTACLFFMYSVTSVFLRVSESLLFNLSLTTSDFFAVVFAKYLFKEKLSPLYWLAVVLNMGGIGIYSWTPPKDAVPFEQMSSVPGPHASIVSPRGYGDEGAALAYKEASLNRPQSAV